ncbi:MAG TPA: response regulator [Rhizomicrobium sp.]|jgi:two-component system LytT family response regulator
MNLRALIIDDMALSRSRTRRYLGSEPGVEIVGECADADTALADIRTLKPDVLLLDVQMPGLNGLDMLKQIAPRERPAVVFITAFEEFAVPAFAAQAVDYLLKPFDRERLQQALARVRAHLRQRGSGPAQSPRQLQAPFLERIAVKSVGRITFVDTAAIDWIETAGNYVALHCGRDNHLVRATMGQIESQLDPRRFVRIHRSTMVRIDAVREIQPLYNGDQTVILTNGDKVVLSRSYREKAQAALGLR